MDKEKIYQLINQNGLTATMIAEALNVTPTAVIIVINNGRGSRRIAEAISKVCDQPLEKIFPYYKGQMSKKEKAQKQQELNEKLAKLA